MLVLTAAALKLIVVIALAHKIRARAPDSLGALIAAWILATAASFGAMFGLSAIGLLTHFAFWIGLGATAAVSGAILLRDKLRLPDFLREGRLVLALFGIFIVAFAIRALIFQDFEPDAQTYGLVRIALWMNYGTVGIHMDTPQINVFTNEWNGELIALFYGLAAGDLQGPIFGNVEVLTVTFFGCAWLARRFDASWSWAFAVAALVALCPACLGLATTVKGDLLAIGAFSIATGWIVVTTEKRDWFSASMLIASLALAVGSKITTGVSAVALAALAAALGLRSIMSPRAIVVGAILSAMFLARFLANAATYGDPFKRIRGETVLPGIDTLAANLSMIWQRAFEFSMHEPGGAQWAYAIGGGLGGTGIALLFAVFLLVVFRRRLPFKLLVTLLAGTLVSCALLPNFWWSLRYFLPAIGAAMVVLMALAMPKRANVSIIAALVVVGGNISYLATPGVLNGNGSFSRALRELSGRGAIERTFLAMPERGSKYKFGSLRLDRSEELSFAVFQDFDRPILAFAGSRAQNRIFLTGKASDIPTTLMAKRTDFAVITKRGGTATLTPALRRKVTDSGYVWVEENDWVAIAVRSDRPEASARFEPEIKSIWRSGQHGRETAGGIDFHWLRQISEIDITVPAGDACIAIAAFATGRAEERQAVGIDVDGTRAAEIDLAGATVHVPRRYYVPVRAAKGVARLRFTAAMREAAFPNDPRPIAFGIAVPLRSANLAACRAQATPPR